MFVLVVSVILLTGVGCVSNGLETDIQSPSKTNSEQVMQTALSGNSYFFQRDHRDQKDVWVLYRINNEHIQATGLTVNVIPPIEYSFQRETITAAVSPYETQVVYLQPTDWLDRIYIQLIDGSVEREVVGPTEAKPHTHMSILDTI